MLENTLTSFHSPLSLVIFFPLLVALGGLFIPEPRSPQSKTIKTYYLLGSVFHFFLFLTLFLHTDFSDHGFDWPEMKNWIPGLNIQYAIGIDGVSGSLLLLTSFLTTLLTLSTFQQEIKKQKFFYFLIFSLESFIFGSFCAIDLFLFYLFWEAMLIPMYFLIGIWGGKERVYATTKFFLYTLAGSLIMLFGIFYLTEQHRIQFGSDSFLLSDFWFLNIPSGDWFSPQSLVFLSFAIAFAIKVPLFPLHTWLPDAHVQAPTAGSVMLASVLLKVGGYGFFRFAMPLFPEALHTFQQIFLGISAIAIVYGSLVAWVQTDMKKLIAYSSISHMGYVILGLFSFSSLGVHGAVYQMLNHGISTGGLFLMIGMLYHRRHSREISDFGGLATEMPLFTLCFFILTLSSIALPGTNGFIGEFLILLGTWKDNPLPTTIAALGVILGAIYMLSLFQKVFFGKQKTTSDVPLDDLSFQECLVLLPLLVLVFWMGLQPQFFFTRMNSAVSFALHRLTSTPHEKVLQELSP